jgi:hypothetical protein
VLDPEHIFIVLYFHYDRDRTRSRGIGSRAYFYRVIFSIPQGSGRKPNIPSVIFIVLFFNITGVGPEAAVLDRRACAVPTPGCTTWRTWRRGCAPFARSTTPSCSRWTDPPQQSGSAATVIGNVLVEDIASLNIHQTIYICFSLNLLKCIMIFYLN